MIKNNQFKMTANAYLKEYNNKIDGQKTKYLQNSIRQTLSVQTHFKEILLELYFRLKDVYKQNT